jgi:hypothetical protein
MSSAFGFGTSTRCNLFSKMIKILPIVNPSQLKEVAKVPGPGEYAPLIVTKKRTPSWG